MLLLTKLQFCDSMGCQAFKLAEKYPVKFKKSRCGCQKFTVKNMVTMF